MQLIIHGNAESLEDLGKEPGSAPSVHAFGDGLELRCRYGLLGDDAGGETVATGKLSVLFKQCCKTFLSGVPEERMSRSATCSVEAKI